MPAVATKTKYRYFQLDGILTVSFGAAMGVETHTSGIEPPDSNEHLRSYNHVFPSAQPSTLALSAHHG